MEARIAEVVALAIIIGCAIRGKHRGLLMQIYSLVRIVLIIVLTVVFKALFLPRIPDYLPSRGGISYALAIIVAIILVAFVDHFLKKITQIPMMYAADVVGGVVIGIAIGVIVDWLLIQLFFQFGDMEWAKQGAGAVQNSPILMYLGQLDIFS